MQAARRRLLFKGQHVDNGKRLNDDNQNLAGTEMTELTRESGMHMSSCHCRMVFVSTVLVVACACCSIVFFFVHRRFPMLNIPAVFDLLL